MEAIWVTLGQGFCSHKPHTTARAQKVAQLCLATRVLAVLGFVCKSHAKDSNFLMSKVPTFNVFNEAFGVQKRLEARDEDDTFDWAFDAHNFWEAPIKV